MKLKKLIITSLLLILVSCGSEDNPLGIPAGDGNSNVDSAPSIVEELQPYVDCEEYELNDHPEYEKVYKCNASIGYLLQHGGDVILDEAFDLNVYVAFMNDPHGCSGNGELLVNGSFEEGHNLGNNKWGVFAAIDGWEADLEKRDAPIEVQNGQNIGGMAPSHGDAKIELDSHAKDGYTRSNARVVQYVSTQAGKSYLLQFDYSARTENNKKTNKVKVFWNGKKVKRVTSKTKGWKTIQLVVSGSDELSKLEFRGAGTEDSYGGYIDNVSLKEICTCL
jgi:hypothetical protein